MYLANTLHVNYRIENSSPIMYTTIVTLRYQPVLVLVSVTGALIVIFVLVLGINISILLVILVKSIYTAYWYNIVIIISTDISISIKSFVDQPIVVIL